MIGSGIIEVAIGLIFVFSLISILVTQINTIVGNVLDLRARHLKDGLSQLLTDPVIRAKIMSHPLIGMLETRMLPEDRITAEKAVEMVESKKAQISWIEPQTFVDVLVDILTGDKGQKLYAALTKAVDEMPPSIEKSEIREMIRRIQISGTGLPELRDAISKLPDETQRQSLLSALHLVEDALDKLGVESSDLIPLLIGIRQIQEPHLQKALEAILSTANSIQTAQYKLAEWFDNNMQRATDVFKKRMQQLSLLVGLLLALLLNVDTLQVARALWNDPALREAVAAAAEASAPQLSEEASQPPANQGDLGGSVQAARSTLDELLNLRLPIGWELRPVDEAVLTAAEASTVTFDPREDSRNLWNFVPGNSPFFWSLLLQKVIGILLTTIAVAQGAPFWFDLLAKITARNQSS